MYRFTLMLLLSTLAFSSHAAGASALQQCRNLQDAAPRLACYDQLADSETTAITSQKTAIPESAAPAETMQANTSQHATATPAPVRNEALFGTSGEIIASSITELTVAVQAIGEDSRQKRLFTMSNGQRWLQLDQAFIKVSQGDSCVITSGMFTSYTMKCQQGSKSIKVRRLQ
jgi:hypothetical protein